MIDNFLKAVQNLCEVLMFENWLRFYFIEENDKGELIIHIPDEGMKRIEEHHAALFPLAEQLNNEIISAASSQQAICTYIAAHIDGNRFKEGLASTVFDSRTFHIEHQVFNVWVQNHEEQLDKQFLDFATWRALYAEWHNSEEVQQQIAALRDTAGRTVEADSQAVN